MAAKRVEPVVVHPLAFAGDDGQLVAGIRQGHPAATVHFYAKFAESMRRLLFRILGPDSELDDVLHDTFVRALESIDSLRDPGALRSWISGIAIHTARARIQRRHRRRWLRFFAPEDLPERAEPAPSPEVSDTLRAVQRVLERLPLDERVAVVLRCAEEMTMPEAAAACGVSLSTFKRRLATAERAFRELSTDEPALRDWWQGDEHGS